MLARCINAALVKRAGGLLLATAAGLCLAAAPGLAKADNFVVNTNLDRNDGSCFPGCSLRDAVALAIATPGADTITFASYVTGSIFLTDGEISINGANASDLTIIGAGANHLTLDADNQSRIFNAHAPVTLTLQGLSLAHGYTNGQGGAVYANGTQLVLDDVTVRDNHSVGKGGGVFALSANVSLTNSTVSGNSGLNGGGFYLGHGDADLVDSTVSGNTASGSAYSAGGGFHVSSGNIHLTNSTLSGNTAMGSHANGGGLFVTGGDVTLVNSTVSGNAADHEGGGFFVFLGQANLKYSTVSGNSATDQGGGFFVDGVGGVGGTASLENSIVANNAAGSHAEFDVDSSVTATYSLVEGSHVPAPAGDSHDNIFGADPGLGPLQDNGGPTMTQAIVSTASAAYNAGENSATNTPAFDQRGAPFARVVGGRIDIGAYEYTQVANRQSGPILTVNTAADPGVEFGCSTSECSLREAVVLANNLPGGNTIGFAPALSSTTITLSGGEIGIRGSDDLVINGSGVKRLVLDGHDTSRIFQSSTTGTLTLENLTLAHGHASGNGGALVANGSNLILDRVTIRDSEAYANGGAFAVSGNVSTVLANSTISGNTAHTGGGFSVDGGSAAVSIGNSTISGNDAIGNGAGLYLKGGSATLASCTVSGNSTYGGNGGGLVMVAGNVTLQNTIVANNTAVGNAGFDVSGSGSSLAANYSLVEGSNSGIDSGSHNILGQDPYLASLRDNGGSSLTQAIISSASPAWNAGSQTLANPPAYDQRGAPFYRVVGGRIDIGAFEYITGQQSGTTLTVNTATDPGAIIGCSPTECSLREAVTRAGNLPGSNTIEFAPGLTSSTITLSGSCIGIDGSDDLTINGPGAGLLSVDASNQSRVLRVTSTGTLTIQGLTLAHGSSDYLSTDNDGGAVYASGTHLVLSGVTIRDSHTNAGGGGFAVLGNAASTTLTNSTLSGNAAIIGGGGFYTDSNVSLANSTVSNNDGGYFGGGLFVYSGNTSITNSTVSGNTAANGGGIIFDYGQLGVNHSTISFNHAFEIGGGINTFGGGVTLVNSIVAKNMADINGAEFIVGPNGSVSANYSLIFGSTLSPPISGSGNLIGVNFDPHLGPLQNNGGPTPTHALLAGSAAIDVGDPAFTAPPGPAFDQRGAPYVRVYGGRLDMGAIEMKITDRLFANGFEPASP